MVITHQNYFGVLGVKPASLGDENLSPGTSLPIPPPKLPREETFPQPVPGCAQTPPLPGVLTELVAVLGGGRDPFAGHLDVLAAGPAVELVLPDLPAAQLVGHGPLVPHVLVKIRRRMILPLCLQREK